MSGPAAMWPDDGPFQALTGRTFRFACHPGVPCFNECCADLNLSLTPYDILRLKARLGMTSDRFIDEHTEPQTGQYDRFPRVRLKMTGGPGKPCPFVRPEGCSVYEDRPGACRTYPLGRGSAAGGREMFFLVKEDHCRGFEETREWEVGGWLSDQGLEEYNLSNDAWMEILMAKKSLGPEEHVVKKLQMFAMASYNLDRFRQFVFGSRFLDTFEVDPERAERARENDRDLLELAFDWLRFALYGEETLPLKGGR